MTAKFKVIAFSSRDTDGRDGHGEPDLAFPDALKTAQELKSQGTAFRVLPGSGCTDEQMQAFADLGAVG